jgi:hypothetical protein
MEDMDFPPAPAVGQLYTAPSSIVYEWDGVAWIVGYYDTATQALGTVGDLLDQIRILLQDTDNSSGQYRYSTESIVLALNQGMLEMFRIRPDLFLETGFIVPKFTVALPSALIGVEEQYIPALVYYTVGLVQIRDDEQTQDGRGAAFIKVFQSALVSGGLTT